MHVGSYWLLHSLRRAAPKRSRWRSATFETIRRTFVKVAVRVEELKGKIKLAFPASFPHAVMLVAIAGTIATRAPMSDAACAARAPPPTTSNAFLISPKPPPSTRLPRHAAAKQASTSRIEWASRCAA